MSWDNKVVWSEGMFLRTQHFQQYDRYVERLVRGRVEGVRPYSWGVTDLQINRELLMTGKFAVTSCHGILPDGTPFGIPDDADHPAPLELPENTRNVIVYLALPVRQPGGVEIDEGAHDETVARYRAVEFEAVDTIAGAETVAGIRVGRLRLRYMLESEDRQGFVPLGLARLVEVRADKSVVLDSGFIPPTLDCAAVTTLSGFIAEVQGLMNHRGEALAARVSGADARGVAEIADFLMLEVINRYQPLLAHLSTTPHVHPEAFYSLAVSMAGELSTFTAANKRPPAFPAYRHDDLQATFQPVMVALRQSLSAVLEQTAIPIPLQLRKYGIRVAVVQDRTLLTQASFVLAVKAEIPTETLRRNFPNQLKIGPVEQIRELVNVALPGIRVRPLPVAPRQIPYHSGTTYFELERTSQYWKALGQSGGIAMHVSGEFPGLDMQFWAIRA